MVRNLFRIYLIFIVVSNAYAQKSVFDESKNGIINRQALQNFYDKLQHDSTVSVLHIGDSHIQANFISHRMRELFQNQYGNAGRGITFPLRLTRTNGHLDIKYYSDIAWERKRIIDTKNSKVGAAGFTISTDEPQFFIKLVNHDSLPISQIKIVGKGLDKLKIGIPNTAVSLRKSHYPSKVYRVKPGDCLGVIARKFGTSVRKLKKMNHLRSSRININQKLIVRTKNKPQNLNLKQFDFVEPVLKSDTELMAAVAAPITDLYLINKTEKNNTPTKIDAVFVTGSEKGVIYNSIGVNGAKYCDYNKSDLFFEELKNISPDLVILSLGTNEAFERPYGTEQFREDLEMFLLKLEKVTACRDILLTTPPSSMIKRRYSNKKLGKFADILKEVAQEKNMAVWDLYDIMGRENGMRKWAENKLAARDRIHFTRQGYYLQAELLYKALLKK